MSEPQSRVQPGAQGLEALWRVVNLVQFVFTVGWTAFWISVAFLATLLAGKRASLWLARRVWAPGLLPSGPVWVEARGVERLRVPGGALLVANHSAYLDIPVLFKVVPRALHFVAKRELARVPLLGWYIAAMGMVFVDRHDRQAALRSLGAAASLLARGELVVTFPEGTRSPDGTLRPFKHGGFLAAIEAGVPVVPVAIEGMSRVMAPRGFRFRPGRVRVAIGEPIPTAGMAHDQRAELARRAEEAVRRLLAELER